MTAIASLADLRTSGKRGLAEALAAIETRAGTLALAALLDSAVVAAKAYVAGLTGPPGVGKSTLTNALLRRWRASNHTVGVIAVDPSSRRTGGALLGDRARLATDPEDRGVFVRSMAARDRLGGLSDQTIGAAALMSALFDRVLVESVGIGQSETDIASVADTVVLCVQPGSGDSLQFMKSGIMEVPDVVVVTKADMADAARRARADVEGALALCSKPQNGWQPPVVLVSSVTGDGIDELDAALDTHRLWLTQDNRLEVRRAGQRETWVAEGVRVRFGNDGLAFAQQLMVGLRPQLGPFRREAEICAELARRLRAS